MYDFEAPTLTISRITNTVANKPLWTESTIVWSQTKSPFLNIIAVNHTDLHKFT